jgi:hypothetical protein
LGALFVLQVLDLHSSLTATPGLEANHLVNLAAARAGSLPALLMAKLIAFGAIGCLYLVWRRFPKLRLEVALYTAVAVAAYSLVVYSNYGGGL